MSDRKAEAEDLLQAMVSCFVRRGRWFQHKDNDGEWVDVSEDLNDYLIEAAELLGIVPRNLEGY